MKHQRGWMKKHITKNRKLVYYFNNLFPYNSRFSSPKKNSVVVGIGGNMGNPMKTFKHLFKMLQSDSRFFIKRTSPILKNPPFGYIDQQDFYNGIIVLQTNSSAKETLKELQRYEKRFKRVRSFQDAPRTLDLDIIFFNNLQYKSKDLIIPHPCYKERDSVMIPLKWVLSANVG